MLHMQFPDHLYDFAAAGATELAQQAFDLRFDRDQLYAALLRDFPRLQSVQQVSRQRALGRRELGDVVNKKTADSAPSGAAWNTP